jgi:5'-nucleotidase
MSRRRRLAALLIATLVGLFALVVGAASSQAAPGYVDHASISFSASGSCGHLTVSGDGFAANEQVTLTLHSKTYTLGTLTTDASGAFSAAVTLPAGVSGNHQITAAGPQDSAQGNITISNCGGQGTNNQGTGGLSNTGVAVISIGAVGVLLLIAGTFFVVTGRRRRALV